MFKHLAWDTEQCNSAAVVAIKMVPFPFSDRDVQPPPSPLFGTIPSVRRNDTRLPHGSHDSKYPTDHGLTSSFE